MTNKKADLKENKQHGTSMNPISVYHNDLLYGSIHLHWHEEIEILFVKQGTFFLGIDSYQFQAKEGDCYIVNSGVLHSIYPTTTEESLHYAILFPLEALGSANYDYTQSRFIDPLLKKEMLFPLCIDGDTVWGDKIKAEIQEMMDSTESKSIGWELSLKGGLFKILSILAKEEKFLLTKPNSGGPKDYKIQVLKSSLTYIQEHYHEGISSHDLAKKANMTTQYYCKLFKSLTGKTPMDYLNQYRINEAAKYLQTKNLPITEICYAVGFENTSYFIKKFKQYKGVTPYQYKKLSI